VSSRCCKKASGWSGCARQTGRTRDIRCGSRKWCFETRNQSPELRTRLARVAEHTLSPYDVFPAATVLRWTLGAAIKGSPGLLLEFLTMGKRGALVARERRAASSSRMRDVNPHR
jgi:hypothetical protein